MTSPTSSWYQIGEVSPIGAALCPSPTASLPSAILDQGPSNRQAGGRTAWSSIVVVCSRRIEARFWYDGKNLNNAKEDAAELALNWLAQQLQMHQGW